MRQIKIWPIALTTCLIPVSAIAIPPTQLNSTTLAQADRSPSQFNLSGQWILRTQDFSDNDNGTACNAIPNREFIKEPIITQNGNELDVDPMTLIITDSSISGNSVYLKGEIFSLNGTVSNDGNQITGTLTCLNLTQPFTMTRKNSPLSGNVPQQPIQVPSDNQSPNSNQSEMLW